MKRLLAAFLLAVLGTQVHAQSLINCATNTACTNNGPSNTGTGDNLPTAGTKINANFLALPSALFNGLPLPIANGGTGATSLANASIPVQTGGITSGHCVTWINSVTIGDAGAACGSGGGSATFQVNGVNLLTSSVVDFLNSAATGGLTITVTNASAGNIQHGRNGGRNRCKPGCEWLRNHYRERCAGHGRHGNGSGCRDLSDYALELESRFRSHGRDRFR